MTSATRSGFPSEFVRLSQAIVLDWVDEPLEAVVRSAGGDVFHAHRIATTSTHHRIYRLAPLARRAFADATRLLSELGEPRLPMWVPVWQFENDRRQKEVERDLDALLSSAVDWVWYARGRQLLDEDLEAVRVRRRLPSSASREVKHRRD